MRRKKIRPWHQDDRFWSTWAPILFNEERWAKTPQDITNVITLLGVKKGARVLDLCCGPGRHSLELARRGFRVTGVDRTPLYLTRARSSARREKLSIEFVRCDMRDFRRESAFDAVINLFTSFGYFENPADDRKVAANVYACLKPGGRLIMELMGKEILARIFLPRSWSILGEYLVLEQHHIEKGWGWIENRWSLIKKGKIENFKLSHRLYSAVELTGLLADVGFSAFEVYGDFARAPYDHTARRLVIVAHKS